MLKALVRGAILGKREHINGTIPARGTTVVVAEDVGEFLARDVVYGTYHAGPLEWIQEKQLYNMPVERAAEISIVDEESATEKKVLFLVSGKQGHREKASVFRFAALAHLKSVCIHPFVDGNGRVARLLMNVALLRAGWSLAIIPPVCRAEYIAALEKSGRQMAPFVRFVRDRVRETQRELLRLLGKSDIVGNDRVKRAGNDRVNDRVNGGEIRRALLAAIEAPPGLRTGALADSAGKSVPTVSRHLKALKAEGKIEFRGAPKTGGYYPL